MAKVSLRRIDIRFALPRAIRRAAVLELDDWREPLEAAGVELAGSGELDLAVAPVERCAEAIALGASAVVLEGRGGARRLRATGYKALRYLPLPSVEAPDLLVPLAPDAPLRYALRTWRPAESRAKGARNAAFAALARHEALPDLRPLQTIGIREPGVPAPIAAAVGLGAPPGARWFLTLGQGDELTRAVFQLFAPGAAEPAWALKLARVRDYEEPFARDEHGLALAREAGGNTSRHAPRLAGRFVVDGHHASLETAAVGERLSTLLPRRSKAAQSAFSEVAAWSLVVGVDTGTRDGLREELARLEREVLPAWDVPAQLVADLGAVPMVLQHNDLGTWNIVSAGPGRFTILDWESARRHGLPLWDLLYFAVDALGLLDRMGSFEERAAHAVRLLRGDLPASSTLFEWIRRYVQELQLPPESVGRLATLCWLTHGLSHVARGAAAGRVEQSAPLPPAERIAPMWLEDPLLGPGWDRWRT